MTKSLLEIDVNLLFLRYGKDVVLDCIRHLEEKSLEEVGEAVAKLARTTKRRQPRKTALEKALEAELQRRPDLADPLKILAANFESKRFLPNLGDVRQFLSLRGLGKMEGGALKTRVQAGPILLQALCELPAEQLAALASTSGTGGESGFSLLTRAILKS